MALTVDQACTQVELPDVDIRYIQLNISSAVWQNYSARGSAVRVAVVSNPLPNHVEVWWWAR